MNNLFDLKVQCDEFDVHIIEFIILRKNSKFTTAFLQKICFQFKLHSRLTINQYGDQHGNKVAEPQRKLLLLKAAPEPKALVKVPNTRQHDMLMKVVASLSKEQLKYLIDFMTQLRSLELQLNENENKNNTKKTKFNEKLKFKMNSSLNCSYALHRKCHSRMSVKNGNLGRPRHSTNFIHK